jgi:mRNA interferase RelE/StbE
MAGALWGLAFGPDATAFLNGPAPDKIRKQLLKKAKTLLNNPHQAGCKKLTNIKHGEEDVWRIRSGDYRILYVVREQEVIVIDIGHRKDVYR